MKKNIVNPAGRPIVSMIGWTICSSLCWNKPHLGTEELKFLSLAVFLKSERLKSPDSTQAASEEYFSRATDRRIRHDS